MSSMLSKSHRKRKIGDEMPHQQKRRRHSEQERNEKKSSHQLQRGRSYRERPSRARRRRRCSLPMISCGSKTKRCNRSGTIITASKTNSIGCKRNRRMMFAKVIKLSRLTEAIINRTAGRRSHYRGKQTKSKETDINRQGIRKGQSHNYINRPLSWLKQS